MTDTFKHKGMRKILVQELRTKGIADTAVLEAIGKIPRHAFMEKAFEAIAYKDQAFPIGEGQTISQPYTVARQTELLQLSKGEKVLEIGTGSGYQTCVLLELGVKVFTIERQKKLFDRTKLFLPSIGYNPKFFYGDGYKGLPAFEPFDKIIVTAGAPIIPPDLVAQLSIGGIMVIPVGAGSTQIMKVLVKTAPNTVEMTEHGAFRFVPLLGDKSGN